MTRRVWPLAPTRRLSLLVLVSVPPVAVLTAVTASEWWVWPALCAPVLLVVFAVDVVLAVRPADLELERRFERSAVRGSTAPFAWVLSNPTRRTAVVAVADEFRPSLGIPRRAVMTLEPRSSSEVEATLNPSRRGRFSLGPMVARSRGPLGLGARQGHVGEVSELRVVPPLRSRPLVNLRLRASRRAPGLRASRGRGSGLEFEQLRDYVPGDDPRHLDWSATARSDRPIVRTYNVERHRPVFALLDTGRVMGAELEGVPLLEHAMDAAFAMAGAVGVTGDRWGAIAYDRHLRAELALGSGRAQRSRLLDLLYDLEAQPVDADHTGALATVTARTRQRASIILFTELHEELVTTALVPALQRVSADHEVLVVANRDPRLDAWLSAAPTEPEALHLAAAAVELLEARERAATSLRDIGAEVIDEPPGRCAEVLVDLLLGQTVA